MKRLDCCGVRHTTNAHRPGERGAEQEWGNKSDRPNSARGFRVLGWRSPRQYAEQYPHHGKYRWKQIPKPDFEVAAVQPPYQPPHSRHNTRRKQRDPLGGEPWAQPDRHGSSRQQSRQCDQHARHAIGDEGGGVLGWCSGAKQEEQGQHSAAGRDEYQAAQTTSQPSDERSDQKGACGQRTEQTAYAHPRWPRFKQWTPEADQHKHSHDHQEPRANAIAQHEAPSSPCACLHCLLLSCCTTTMLSLSHPLAFFKMFV